MKSIISFPDYKNLLHLRFVSKLLSLICTLFMAGCFQNKNIETEHSFYYWQTSFADTANVETYISKENINHFYIRFFDVSWDDNLYMPAPVAEITGLQNIAPFIKSHFTPVIFITNKCLQRMDDDWADSLACKIRNKITFITNRINQECTGANILIDEIQIDCDWTEMTQKKYFRFLRAFKSLYPGKIISATIRLYPYKYFRKTGVPPVDRGLLMCYNLTDIKDAENVNSIFELKNLKQYLVSEKYPLHLDIALPVFGWYAWFSEGNFKGIIYPDEKDSLTADKRFFSQKENNFLLTGDTVVGNNYLREGDVLRLEYPDKNELEKAATLLHNKFPEARRIALFYWNMSLIKRNEEVIHKIFTAF